MAQNLDHVNYDALDTAKNAFIQASKSTIKFAEKYGFIPDAKFGASANVFSLNLKDYLAKGAENLYITLLPEGLGTADDARPDDLTPEELECFWHNIGTKTMGVLTNDAAATGMQTVLISLYLPSAAPEIVFNEGFMKGFLKGFVDGCRHVGCVYFSGETPQLKNKIHQDKLDIAGALFGLMPAGVEPIDSGNMSAGDKIVFVESAGPDANGFTSLRKMAEELPDGYRTKLPSGMQYWEAINAPTKLYTPFIQQILAEGIHPTNVEPITGHGWQKLMRPSENFRYVIDEMLPVPEIFEFVGDHSNTPPQEMIKIFNYGVGYAVFAKSQEDADRIVEIAKENDLNAVVAGEVQAADTREVVVNPLNTTLSSEEFLLSK